MSVLLGLRLAFGGGRDGVARFLLMAFGVGLGVMMLLLGVQEGEWDEIAFSVRNFQNANMNLRYSKKPVVVAVHGMALGGGCEVTMHGDRARASAESYIGLVEVGVGLIPGGGGVKELVLRAVEGALPDEDQHHARCQRPDDSHHAFSRPASRHVRVTEEDPRLYATTLSGAIYPGYLADDRR